MLLVEPSHEVVAPPHQTLTLGIAFLPSANMTKAEAPSRSPASTSFSVSPSSRAAALTGSNMVLFVPVNTVLWLVTVSQPDGRHIELLQETAGVRSPGGWALASLAAA